MHASHRLLTVAAAVLALSAPAATLAQAGAPASGTRAADDSLFRDLGGLAGIRTVVEDFVAIVLDDRRINAGFKDADLPRLKDKLAEQFCELAGGPCQYSGKDMQTIHDGLNITMAQFNALAEDLQLALERNGVPTRVQNRLIAKLAPMYRQIVTR